MPLVLKALWGSVRVPPRDVVLVDGSALGMGDEAEVAPCVTHGETAVPGSARTDASSNASFNLDVAGKGSDDEVAVGAYEIHTHYLVAEPSHDTVRDGLQGVGQTAGNMKVLYGRLEIKTEVVSLFRHIGRVSNE